MNSSSASPPPVPLPSPAGEGLAVVIPAYKGAYLTATLGSFAAQTDRRFRIYIGDDASPDDLAAIVAPFRSQLDLIYHRFPTNLGRTSLTRHWDRVIALSQERWIWLFSDDDFVSPDCVAGFWTARARDPAGAGLLRFQCDYVAAEGQPISGIRMFRYPPHQTWEEHVHGPALRGVTYTSIVQNVIFPREIYLRHHGFYDYPLGFWSDFITWARFSREEGLTLIPAGSVFYRIHASSIGGHVFVGGGDRCNLLRIGGRMFADLRLLYAEVGRRPPRWEFLRWFSRLFQFSPQPLNAAERAAAREALRLGWPDWPLLREAVFWFSAGRPMLRNLRWVVALYRFGRK
jgi:glycosyltransferase involved in cell wall biosynthesis